MFMTKKFEKGLVTTLRELLLAEQQVAIKGLGVFRVEHQKQSTKRMPDGKTILLPPRDVVIFNGEELKQ